MATDKIIVTSEPKDLLNTSRSLAERVVANCGINLLNAPPVSKVSNCRIQLDLGSVPEVGGSAFDKAIVEDER